MTNRPVVGISLAGIAAIHLACTPMFYRAEWAAVFADGFVNAISGTDRDGAFFYVTVGFALLIAALIAGLFERRAGRLPVSVGVLLVGIAAFELLLMPDSGFWLLLVPAAIIFWQAARKSGGSAASSAAAATGSAATADRVH